MPSIERMTRHALLAGGIAERDLDPLLNDALNGHRVCKRKLERAMGAYLRVRLAGERSGTRIDNALRRHRREGIVTARLNIARGVVWEDDSLWCEAPDTVRIAVLGRPLSAVLDHPALDAKTTILTPRKVNALLSIDRQTSSITRSSVRQRIRQLGARLGMRVNDLRSDQPIPAMRLPLGCLAAVMLGVIVWEWANIGTASSDLTLTSRCLMIGAALISIAQFLNAMSKRPLMVLRPLMAQADHNEHINMIREKRT